jgi:hypothetical protein
MEKKDGFFSPEPIPYQHIMPHTNHFICNEWTVDSDPKYWDNINAICGG